MFMKLKGGVYDWFFANDLDEPRIDKGILVTESTGNEPYMISSMKNGRERSRVSGLIRQIQMEAQSLLKAF
jgi:hypothetical protein